MSETVQRELGGSCWTVDPGLRLGAKGSVPQQSGDRQLHAVSHQRLGPRIFTAKRSHRAWGDGSDGKGLAQQD